jgi:alpha-ketoglutaric semialdehyde dehydrogenase
MHGHGLRNENGAIHINRPDNAIIVVIVIPRIGRLVVEQSDLIFQIAHACGKLIALAAQTFGGTGHLTLAQQLAVVFQNGREVIAAGGLECGNAVEQDAFQLRITVFAGAEQGVKFLAAAPHVLLLVRALFGEQSIHARLLLRRFPRSDGLLPFHPESFRGLAVELELLLHFCRQVFEFHFGNAVAVLDVETFGIGAEYGRCLEDGAVGELEFVEFDRLFGGEVTGEQGEREQRGFHRHGGGTPEVSASQGGPGRTEGKFIHADLKIFAPVAAGAAGGYPARMDLIGLSFIGAQRGQSGGATFHGYNPATGESLTPEYHSASAAEVERAAQLAAAAFPVFSATTGKQRGAFLRAIAANIEALGDTLYARVMAETALPEARVKGETARTCGQLRLFAGLVEEGSWVDARIDHALPDRQPLPRPDVRSMLRPIGPVLVFGASNFPLAYSTAGGDVASALAAGCPVIVKAHAAHPGTGELVANAVRRAVSECSLPEGVFSCIFDSQRQAAMTLVKHSQIAGVGFTGSRAGGRALMDAAAARPAPIPVYAEMSSVNPLCLMAGALKERGTAIAAGLHSSATLGVGQFCTNPGLVLFDRTADVSAFRDEFARLMSSAPCGTMLTKGICASFHEGRSRLAEHPEVKQIASATPAGGNTATPVVFETTAEAVLGDHSLMEEVFGPCTLLIGCEGIAGMTALMNALEGQLTASFHGTPDDFASAGELLAAAERRAGRLIFNSFPTGLEVCPAIVHGGPYPATSDGRSTSVGTAAILRWVRSVCWQDFAEALLPDELKEANPLGIARLVEGQRK